MIEILPARTAAELASVAALFQEYSSLVSEALCFQGFDAELAGLPGAYAPPTGALLLARGPDGDAGCVAMKRLDARRAEMKRMFVRDDHRGTGLGRRLALAIIAEARGAGYEAIYLDTLPKLKTAISLYESLGFRACGAYLDAPTPGALCFELRLA